MLLKLANCGSRAELYPIVIKIVLKGNANNTNFLTYIDMFYVIDVFHSTKENYPD